MLFRSRSTRFPMYTINSECQSTKIQTFDNNQPTSYDLQQQMIPKMTVKMGQHWQNSIQTCRNGSNYMVGRSLFISQASPDPPGREGNMPPIYMVSPLCGSIELSPDWTPRPWRLMPQDIYAASRTRGQPSLPDDWYTASMMPWIVDRLRPGNL